MSHIDLYSELSLDRSLDSEEIDRRLAQQLAETPESDNARRDMLATSRAILGNSQRRAVYDNGLADPNAPEWTVRRLHSLASGQDADSNGSVTSGFTPTQAALVVRQRSLQPKELLPGIRHRHTNRPVPQQARLTEVRIPSGMGVIILSGIIPQRVFSPAVSVAHNRTTEMMPSGNRVRHHLSTLIWQNSR